MDIQAIRINNLRKAIEEKADSAAEFGRKYGLDPSYLSQILNKHRGFGEKAARTIEEKIGMARGGLDSEPSENTDLDQLAAIFVALEPESQKHVLDAARARRALEKEK